ncbi:LysR family transcriptional regulator [Kiloniella majae]|uniref:LysR family transcriptional regulator n=1 Tax=Kiloniella majae TaxID=1938558 RepID=UPI000A27747B|nr:LysR family transcriptional regulator [Kiloniella majae]
MKLDTLDLRQLRVFLTVADCGGFSQAQAELNISISTISIQMSDLETRLGMRLCQRGRTGFSLTREGERVYNAAKTLFNQIDGFTNELHDLRQELSGKLSLGITDNLITHPNSSIAQSLHELFNLEGKIETTINILPPNLLEREVLDQRLDIAIGAFPKHLPGLHYQPLFTENQILYCGSRHPLFHISTDKLKPQDLTDYRIAQRGYTAGRPHPSNIKTIGSGALSYQMEGLVYLVLSGHFLAHLPDHLAQKWVESGEMKALNPQELGYQSTFELVARAGTHPSPVLDAFKKCFAESLNRERKRGT